MEIVKRFLHEDAGQDLIEYTLLMLFVVIAALVIMQQTGNSVLPVWAAGSSVVQNAAIQSS